MPGRSHRRQQLEQELHALGDDAMLIEEFDGFVAGLLVCPEMISPNEWLPFGLEPRGSGRTESARRPRPCQQVVRPDHGELQRCRADIDESTRYRPLFPVDARNDDIIWEIWVEGF